MIISLFPRADNDEPLPTGSVVGDRAMVHGHVAKIIDRVCPHCFRLGPPFGLYFEVAGGEFKGCRWCPTHNWVNSGRICRNGS